MQYTLHFHEINEIIYDKIRLLFAILYNEVYIKSQDILS